MKAAFAIPAILVFCFATAMPSQAANKLIRKGTTTPSPRAAVANTIAPAAEAVKPVPKAVEPAPEGARPAVKKAATAAVSPEGLHVSLQDGLLSVNAKDQSFGDIIALIANSAGFDVEISNDVYDMKLSTRFDDTKLQRGIIRLISLINQKNYFMDYSPDGSIKKLEIYGDLSTGQRTLSGQRPAAVKTPETTPARKRQMAPPPTPPTMVVPQATPKKRITPPPANEAEEATEEPMEEEEVLDLYFKHFNPDAGKDDSTGEPDGGNSPSPTPTPNPVPAPAPSPAPAPVPSPSPGPSACPPGMTLAPTITCPEPPCVPETEPASGTCILDAPVI